MLTASLKPIDSNLRRIQLAFGSGRNEQEKETESLWPAHGRALSIHDRLLELRFSLLGAMVTVKGLHDKDESTNLLKELRVQILIFRRLKDILEDREYFAKAELKELTKSIFVLFYDLEGMFRKLSSGKLPANKKQSDLITAIADKSKAAVGLSLSKTI